MVIGPTSLVHPVSRAAPERRERIGAVERYDEVAESAPAVAESSRNAAEVYVSRHAAARLRSRGIELPEEELREIGHAIDRLSAKGARESLLLVGENAFIVGVERRTVITALSRQEAVGSIFTNIDSTLVIR